MLKEHLLINVISYYQKLLTSKYNRLPYETTDTARDASASKHRY